MAKKDQGKLFDVKKPAKCPPHQWRRVSIHRSVCDKCGAVHDFA